MRLMTARFAATAAASTMSQAAKKGWDGALWPFLRPSVTPAVVKRKNRSNEATWAAPPSVSTASIVSAQLETHAARYFWPESVPRSWITRARSGRQIAAAARVAAASAASAASIASAALGAGRIGISGSATPTLASATRPSGVTFAARTWCTQLGDAS